MVFIHGASCARGVGLSAAARPAHCGPTAPPPSARAAIAAREPCCCEYEDCGAPGLPTKGLAVDAVGAAKSARWHRDLLDLLAGHAAHVGRHGSAHGACCTQEEVECAADAVLMWRHASPPSASPLSLFEYVGFRRHGRPPFTTCLGVSGALAGLCVDERRLECDWHERIGVV